MTRSHGLSESKPDSTDRHCCEQIPETSVSCKLNVDQQRKIESGSRLKYSGCVLFLFFLKKISELINFLVARIMNFLVAQAPASH